MKKNIVEEFEEAIKFLYYIGLDRQTRHNKALVWVADRWDIKPDEASQIINNNQRKQL